MRNSIYDNMVRELFGKENKRKYSHLIIVIDTDDQELVKFFVKRGENIKNSLFNIISNPNYEIKEIYNYDMDLEKQISENRAYHINFTYNKVNDAYKFAEEKHRGQLRENGSPYINHPCSVAKIVEQYFPYHPRINDFKVAAYLHDTVEDTDATIEEIEERFGKYVAYLVDGVTTDETLKKKMGKVNYLCFKMLNMDDDVLNLKLCDRLANILDLDNAPSDFIDKYTTETLIIINHLVNNRKMDNIKLEIIKDISSHINVLIKEKIKKLVDTINN